MTIRGVQSKVFKKGKKASNISTTNFITYIYTTKSHCQNIIPSDLRANQNAPNNASVKIMT